MKILTLNTWQERGPWRERWEVTFDGLQSLQPDLVFFQELFNPDWVEEIKKRTKLQYSAFSDKAAGLVILSPHPITETALHTMRTRSPQEDYQRYALYAGLEIQGRPLCAFNTHLSWKLDDGPVRLKQVEELMAFIAEKAGERETAVAGDFNAPAHTPEIKKMTEEGGYTDTFKALHPDQPGLTWDQRNPYAKGCNHPLPDRRIDYLFVKNTDGLLGKIKSAEVIFDQPDAKGFYASDHFGLLVEFE